MSTESNQSLKLHNAAWPGLVGKGEDGEPPIDLDTLLDLTAKSDLLLISQKGYSTNITQI